MNIPLANCESIALPHPAARETTLSIWRKIGCLMARFVFGKLLPRWAYPVLRGPLRGSWYFLGATAGEAGGISVHLGVQEQEQACCLTRILRPAQIFFDIGANVGFYSLLASRLVGPSGRVIAFEPLPRNIAFLHRHIALNRRDNISIFPLACARSESTALFVTGTNNALGHLTDSQNAGALVVGTVSLDSVVKKLGVVPDVIKIDIEGAELEALEGAAQLLDTHKPSILLSTHSDELRSACLRNLRAHGYKIEALNAGSIESATEFVATVTSLYDEEN